MKPNLLILFSGGADSVLMLSIALGNVYNPYCVLVDYDQNHKIELDYAQRYLNEKSVPHQIVKLYQLGLHSGLTTGEKSLYEGVNEMYVPSRNLMFVSIAASIAEDKGIYNIWYGANFSDRQNGFPDCTPEWVKKVNGLLNINASVSITLRAPLIDYPKEVIMDSLKRRNIDMGKIYSGYLEDNEEKIIDLSFLGDRKLPKIDAKKLLGSEGDD